ncbi:OLC1v1002274C1 [Oldenlandia corymbosa var. corymbosa]|uniref:OLC1v1002274C1 n=1 Tax=Oldenlandia corymbosa var. corymbosa TaxID=529605 RepID=A0AAV1D792_OLDCO|nr:OLC1v1002274C1 [Oldenlandia corymbosa var. corymbosa]
MKIQCDVCDVEEASVFCSADEAALCESCDARVHHANKLASKHLRFSLMHPSSSKESPSCDICQERRALLFCQQDRALLCRECDGPIHNANLHTQKHTRFLLTGVKLSASSTTFAASSSSPSSSSTSSSAVSNNVGSSSTRSCTRTDRKIKDPVVNFSPSYHMDHNNNWASESTSNQEGFFPVYTTNDNNISEYLTENLPGWHVGDFLDPSSCSPYGFSEAHEQNIPTFMHEEEFPSSYGCY